MLQYPLRNERKVKRVSQSSKKDVDKVSKVLHNVYINWPGPKAEKHKSARERESD